MAVDKSKPTGYLYRGPSRVVEFDLYKIRLVQDETYVIPDLQNIKDGYIQVKFKKPGASIKLAVPLTDYYMYISSGRTSFKDVDPYKGKNNGY